MAQNYEIFESQYSAQQIEDAITNGVPLINSTNKHWMRWDVSTQAWVDTGIIAEAQTTGAIWGQILGTLSDQTDLNNALNNKVGYTSQSKTEAEKQVARENIGSPSAIELLDLKMLGWTVPKEMPIQNSVSGNTYTQRVGRVDLGSLSWSYNTDRFLNTTQTDIKRPSSSEVSANIFCHLYNTVPLATISDNMTIAKSGANNNLVVFNETYTDASTFKTAMVGVYLYYELATPITKTVDGREWTSSLSNRNLLDNGWFTVNQRGLTTYQGAGGEKMYTVDRWYVEYPETSKVEVVSNGVKITPTATRYFRQIMETPPTGKVCTISAIIDGILYSYTFTFGTSQTFPTTTNTNIIVTNDAVSFRFATSGTAVTITAVKLELGSVSTLANDVAPNYAEELAKCQRYFYRFKKSTQNNKLWFGTGIASSINRVCYTFFLPTEMRVDVPTVSYSNLPVLYDEQAGTQLQTVNSFGRFSNANTQSRCQIFYADTSYSLTVGKTYFIQFNYDDYVDFSADL